MLAAELEAFEAEFAEYCGTAHCVGVGNGTDALKLALDAMGVGPGGEVVTAARTFIATVEAIAATGAKPVLVDVDPATRNIDPLGRRRGRARHEGGRAGPPLRASGRDGRAPRRM